MSSSSETTSVGALLKGFAIIEQLSSGQTSLTDIARRTGLPKSSTFRLLATLGELGIVSRGDSDDSYQLTTKMFEYGALAIRAFDLVEHAKSEMYLVREQTGEAVHLFVRSETHAVCLYSAESRYSLRMHAYIGMSCPLYSTALGKTLLAWLSPTELADVVGKMVFRRYAPETITDPEAFMEHLAWVKATGYAFNNGEYEPETFGIAMPVFDHYNQPAASISVALPTMRYSSEKAEVIVRALYQAAEATSKRLGCRVFPVAPPSELPFL